MASNNVGLLITKTITTLRHFDTLHPTILHYIYRHFTSTHLHFTTLSFGVTHCHFVPRQGLERFLHILFQILAASVNEHQKEMTTERTY